LVDWRANFLFVVNRKEQESAEDVAAVKAAVQGTVPVGAFGQPQFQGLVPETHGAVFNELVVPQRLNFGNGAQHDE
jgi:hypothetical protein